MRIVLHPGNELFNFHDSENHNLNPVCCRHTSVTPMVMSCALGRRPSGSSSVENNRNRRLSGLPASRHYYSSLIKPHLPTYDERVYSAGSKASSPSRFSPRWKRNDSRNAEIDEIFGSQKKRYLWGKTHGTCVWRLRASRQPSAAESQNMYIFAEDYALRISNGRLSRRSNKTRSPNCAAEKG